jgi:uncharacterized protein YbdZ (MbtH family)
MLMIIKHHETYGTVPSGPVPAGWTLVRDGFQTKAEAQVWLWAAIDSIPEGYGLP